MRVIEVIAEHGNVDTLRGIAEQNEVFDIWTGQVDEDGRSSTRMLVQPDKQQSVLDALQAAVGASENARILILPVEASLPRPAEETDEEEQKRQAVTRSREELYESIISSAKLDANFIAMVVMSTIVAAIGLLEDNVAVVIGAMVIAPLLGPNIAIAFATALGDGRLVLEALKSNLVGLFIALSLAILIGLLWPLNFDSHELISRTDVGMDGIALALVSGAAAVLSITTGWRSSIVGVMVAVAILPPTATLGLMIGAGNYRLALGAGLLLVVNVVCVNLTAKLTFLAKGVKPRTWLEKRKAKQSIITYIIFWLVLLIILVMVIKVRGTYLPN